MPRWLAALSLLGAIFIPTSARAQTPIALSSLQVQLWPEYDQPSMLVIYDFQVGPGTELPVGISIRFPKDANLVAVAVQRDTETLLNADYLQSVGVDEWQSVIVQVQSPATYRIEYFQPFSRSGDRRQFSYEWTGDFEVQDFSLRVRLPADATVVTADPQLQRGEKVGPTYFLEKDFGRLAAGRNFAFSLEYSRTSEALMAPSQELQPSKPLDSSTPGRVMLSNYVPYILGALGFVLIAGASLYFWQSSRGGASGEKRRHGSAHSAAQGTGDVYCNQCGTRAQSGDRFCRVCGTRLRLPQ